MDGRIERGIRTRNQVLNVLRLKPCTLTEIRKHLRGLSKSQIRAHVCALDKSGLVRPVSIERRRYVRGIKPIVWGASHA
ncbi:ArsR family transcriptional regulator [Uliginosibacterium sp. 31-12]|uniref:ArsR family transcriptional regulator n=1 Tax=Uliginosibacterium sp. 31-12 TaxID=3062781 RepID=UPI0034C6DCDF